MCPLKSMQHNPQQTDLDAKHLQVTATPLVFDALEAAKQRALSVLKGMPQLEKENFDVLVHVPFPPGWSPDERAYVCSTSGNVFSLLVHTRHTLCIAHLLPASWSQDTWQELLDLVHYRGHELQQQGSAPLWRIPAAHGLAVNFMHAMFWRQSRVLG